MCSGLFSKHLKETEKNIIIGYKVRDLIAGIFSLGFVVLALLVMDKDGTSFWVTLIFFGICSSVLLWQFINPKNRFIGKNSAEAKLIREKKFKHLYNTSGLFNYTEKGFELTLNGKLTKTDWDEVKRIIAYKIDLLATDEICLFVDIDENRSFEIGESTKGWFVFVNNIKDQFPEINKSWEFDIAIPPFERTETELYNRVKAFPKKVLNK